MPSKDFKDDVDDPNGYYSPTTSHPATIEVARQPVIASIKPRTIALSIRQTANDYLGSDSNADIDIQYLHAGQQFDHDALLSLLTPYHEVIGEPENGVIYISIFAVPTKRWSIGNKFDLSAVMREIYASGFSYGILTMRPWLFVSADTHIPSHAFLPSVPKGASLTTSPPLIQSMSSPFAGSVPSSRRRVTAASPSISTTLQVPLGGDRSNQDSAGENWDNLMQEIEDHSHGSTICEDPETLPSRQRRRRSQRNHDINPKWSEDKTNSDITKRKPRQPRPRLVQWNDNDWRNLCLGMVWACGAAGVEIPFEEAAKVVGPNVTQGAAQQAILKLRNQQIENGYDIPRLKMSWTRKKKTGVSGEHGANDGSSEDPFE